MINNQPTLASIMMSCTWKILSIAFCIYSLYLFNDFFLDIYNNVKNLTLIGIISIHSFILGNIFIIFFIWIFIFSWLCCVMLNLERNNIKQPSFLIIPILVLLPIGGIILSYLGISFFAEYDFISFICYILVFIICAITFGLYEQIFTNKKFTNKKESDEKQLDLFK